MEESLGSRNPRRMVNKNKLVSLEDIFVTKTRTLTLMHKEQAAGSHVDATRHMMQWLLSES